mmetsp:Transcript_15797/g.41819  ORF Transcript_15797/g.41819 Transcript_15797/m.41819 type:complete len:260 (-) Transcript_15797:487-1266(-)
MNSSSLMRPFWSMSNSASVSCTDSRVAGKPIHRTALISSVPLSVGSSSSSRAGLRALGVRPAASWGAQTAVVRPPSAPSARPAVFRKTCFNSSSSAFRKPSFLLTTSITWYACSSKSSATFSSPHSSMASWTHLGVIREMPSSSKMAMSSAPPAEPFHVVSLASAAAMALRSVCSSSSRWFLVIRRNSSNSTVPSPSWSTSLSRASTRPGRVMWPIHARQRFRSAAPDSPSLSRSKRLKTSRSFSVSATEKPDRSRTML